MRILIAGCGYVGTALGLELAAQGHTVFALRRRPQGIPGPLHPLAADLTDPHGLKDLPDGLDAVFYTAAASGRSEVAYRAAYVDGLSRLLDVLVAGSGPPRVFFTSSTAVYGQDDGGWVDEDSPSEPRGFNGKLVLEGERRLRDAGLPGASLRLGGIYGPGRTRLVESVRRGEARLAPGPPRWTNRIHRDDAAGCLRHLLGFAAPAPVYLGVDCEPADRGEVLRWLAARLGVAPPGLAEAAEPAAGHNKRCRNARLLASGYQFRYPTFREGYAALLAEAR